MSDNLIRKQEAKDFDYLFMLLSRMDKTATHMVINFLRELEQPDAARLKKICDEDSVLDLTEIAINEEVVVIISRWQPVANDLRMMLSAIKIAIAYERIGDYIHSNCRKLIFALENNIDLQHLDLISLKKIGDRLVDVMHLVSEDLKNRTSDRVNKIKAEDSIIDDLYRQVYEKGLTIDAKKNTAGVLKTVMIGKYLERIGDQLRNIAEALSYATSGRPPAPERVKK